MFSLSQFDQMLQLSEKEIIANLDSPFKIQTYLDTLKYSDEPIYRCPLQVLRDSVAHCFDGAVFAAAMLSRLGYPPLILDMVPNDRDDDHLLALFKQYGHWGAVAKSNFVGLRFREPVFRNLRELVLSYFEAYYNLNREKTLRGYTLPLNLKTFDKFHWLTSDKTMDLITEHLDKMRRFSLLTPEMIAELSPLDERSYLAGLQGANEAGLYKPFP